MALTPEEKKRLQLMLLEAQAEAEKSNIIEDPLSAREAVETFQTALGQSAGFNLVDEAVALKEGTTDEERIAANELIEEQRNKNVLNAIAGYAGDVVGALPASLYVAGRLIKPGATLFKTGMAAEKAIVPLAAASGATSGAGAGEGLEGRAVGALLGGTIGGVVPAAGKAGAALSKRIVSQDAMQAAIEDLAKEEAAKQLARTEFVKSVAPTRFKTKKDGGSVSAARAGFVREPERAGYIYQGRQYEYLDPEGESGAAQQLIAPSSELAGTPRTTEMAANEYIDRSLRMQDWLKRILIGLIPTVPGKTIITKGGVASQRPPTQAQIDAWRSPDIFKIPNSNIELNLQRAGLDKLPINEYLDKAVTYLQKNKERNARINAQLTPRSPPPDAPTEQLDLPLGPGERRVVRDELEKYNYELTGELGRGQKAVVYSAEGPDPSGEIPKNYAVKIYNINQDAPLVSLEGREESLVRKALEEMRESMSEDVMKHFPKTYEIRRIKDGQSGNPDINGAFMMVSDIYSPIDNATHKRLLDFQSGKLSENSLNPDESEFISALKAIEDTDMFRGVEVPSDPANLMRDAQGNIIFNDLGEFRMNPSGGGGGGTRPKLPPTDEGGTTPPAGTLPFIESGSPQELQKSLSKYIKKNEVPVIDANGGVSYEAAAIKWERGGSARPIAVNEKIKDLSLPTVYPRIEKQVKDYELVVTDIIEELKVINKAIDPQNPKTYAALKKKQASLEKLLQEARITLAEFKIKHIYKQRPDWAEKITADDGFGNKIKVPKVEVLYDPKRNSLYISDNVEKDDAFYIEGNTKIKDNLGNYHPGVLSMDIAVSNAGDIDPDTNLPPAIIKRSSMFSGSELMQYLMYFFRHETNIIQDYYIATNADLYNKGYNETLKQLKKDKSFSETMAKQLALREAALATWSAKQHASRGFELAKTTATERSPPQKGKPPLIEPMAWYEMRPKPPKK